LSPSQDTGRDTIVDLSDIRKRRSDRNHPKRLAVLMVEDDEVDATLIEMALQKSTWFAVEVTRARTLSEAQDMCRVNRP